MYCTGYLQIPIPFHTRDERGIEENKILSARGRIYVLYLRFKGNGLLGITSKNRNSNSELTGKITDFVIYF